MMIVLNSFNTFFSAYNFLNFFSSVFYCEQLVFVAVSLLHVYQHKGPNLSFGLANKTIIIIILLVLNQ